MRRFAAIAQRTRPRRAKRTGARYSPPPTPVKPERTPIGSAKRLPTASPSRRSARVPEGASKESSRRIGAPSTFRSLRLTHLSRLASATRKTSKAVDHRDAYRSADGTFTLSVQGGRTECDPDPLKSSLGSAVPISSFGTGHGHPNPRIRSAPAQPRVARAGDAPIDRAHGYRGGLPGARRDGVHDGRPRDLLLPHPRGAMVAEAVIPFLTPVQVA